MRSLILGLITLSLVGCTVASEEDAGSEETSGAVSATAPITLRNWSRHPTIVAVDRIVASTDGAKLTEETKTLCSSAGEQERVKRSDASGKIRSLSSRWGNEWGGNTDTFYYDDASRLRLAKRVGMYLSRTTPGEVYYEDLVYFDAGGTKVWSVSRQGKTESALERAKFVVTPPENNFDSFISEEKRTSPSAAFDAPSGC